MIERVQEMQVHVILRYSEGSAGSEFKL